MTDLPGGAGERGPLPPHERAWRHPSELAAPPLEATTRGGRVLIISTATVSLLLVGMLALLMTPDRARRSDDIEAIVTDFVTFTPAAGAADSTGGTGRRVGHTTAAAAATSLVATAGRTVTTPAVTSAFGNLGSGRNTSTSRPPADVTIAEAVMVTPVGDGLVVATEAAVDGVDGSINAVLPSGDTVPADVIARSDGVVFLAVAETHEAMSIADDVSPTDALYVTIDGTSVPVDSTVLAAATFPEGMPVLNSAGSLVGLYTHGPDGIEVVPVGSLPDLPTTTVPATDSSAPEASAAEAPPSSEVTSGSTGTPASDPDSSSPALATASAETSTSTSTSTSTTTPPR